MQDKSIETRQCICCLATAHVRRGFTPIGDGEPVIVAIGATLYVPGRGRKAQTTRARSFQVCTRCLERATRAETPDNAESIWKAFRAAVLLRCSVLAQEGAA